MNTFKACMLGKCSNALLSLWTNRRKDQIIELLTQPEDLHKRRKEIMDTVGFGTGVAVLMEIFASLLMRNLQLVDFKTVATEE